MAERSFASEVQTLRLGEGELFEGEGILAVTKALLQSGVAYVGGYQGAPISHLMDVLADAEGILNELGVHFEASASEATAAAMLAASINYPLRGAVTWKSTVGTNVASDALSNLASAGVKGGAIIVLGEDYGEGASIMQERTHAFAMKSQMWLLDPRPQLPAIVAAVEHAFELSEASNTPVMLMLRIRACHVSGRFVAKDNRRPAFSAADALAAPSRDYGRIILPPSTYAQEREKIETRLPAALRFIRERGLNEFMPGDLADIGIVLQGGLYNNTLRALELLGYADVFGTSRIPLYVLNVTYPLVSEEWVRFCAGKRAVLVIEEGQPEFIEQAANQMLRRQDLNTRILVGKEVLPVFGEYTVDHLRKGIGAFLAQWAPPAHVVTEVPATRKTDVSPEAAAKLAALVPARPSGLCTGCPERPFFAAMKILQKEVGPLHISADIGCHSFATLPPFNMGNSIMGYGLGAAGASAFGTDGGKRAVSIMGDGGFWHNGLTSGIGNSVFNKHDDLTVIIDNGYSAATGGQDILSSRGTSAHRQGNHSIVEAVKGIGIKWVRRTSTYDMRVDAQGAARGAAYHRARPQGHRRGRRVPAESPATRAAAGAQGHPERRASRHANASVSIRIPVPGDHSCIRLSGCPSLTVKANPDPLRSDPVAHVDNSCVGCGVCGEVADAAVLCPSFYRADLIHNPSRWDRLVHAVRAAVIGTLQRRDERRRLRLAL